ncbi:Golgi phosphoprotein 3 GPP34 [Prauserella shujinwangii]|uniref:Golgi phosphoprotein 3 GPP34 n=1 Tax=Prauserella shujinwangii TaxID=1453103 RepID=A0A2T0LU73_9PSEU|nr:GPP34 family phosphoprotein [Prauserella shujinwangii]PRX47287.1 Golgi phosphoprotein 3 GPP34 [Prauserella shujinwangii]
MVIAEDLLLLLFDDESGKPAEGVRNLGYSLAGALLIELAMQGRVDVSDGTGEEKAGRLVVLDETPTGTPVLDDALGGLAGLAGRKPKDVIGPLARDDLRGRLLDGLADRGVLRREEGRILGLFPTTRWPAEDSGHEAAVRDGLRRVLVDGERPDERMGALIALLVGMGVVRRVVDGPDPKAVERRAKEIAEGNWAGDAMRRAVDEMTAAVMAAVFVPTIVAGTGT